MVTVSPTLTPRARANSEPITVLSPSRSSFPATMKRERFAHLLFQRGIDAPDLGSHALVIELHDDRTLHERGGRLHAAHIGGLAREILPTIQQAVVADKQMGVEADHLALQFPLEPGHDRHDEDQDSDAEGDPQHGDQRDHGQERPLGPQIAGGKKVGPEDLRASTI